MSYQAADAAFFETVHSLIAEQDFVERTRERREGERHTFPCIQFVAPYDGNRLPAQDEFMKVACKDLSSNGFSFKSMAQPEHDQVVIALGAAPFLFYVAEIRSATPMHNSGLLEYLIGCKIVHQLTRENCKD